jgi:hypothetical protein
MVMLPFFSSEDSSEQNTAKNEIISDQKIEFEIGENIESSNSKSNTETLSNTVNMQAPTGTNRIISGVSGNVVPVAAAAAAADPSPPKKECTICCEKYNRSNHCPIACPSCSFEACRQCHSTFILDISNPLPNCMECHKEFPRDFLVEKFTQKFVTQDWKKHREQVIYQKEKALLPTRQRVAELVKRKDVLRDEELGLNAEIAKLEARRRDILVEKNRIDYRIRIGPAADNEGAAAGGNKREQHAAFVRPCPNTEANCRGFLSTQWKCNLCNMWACKECHEIKGDSQDSEHTCHPDNLASAKLIDAETRGCPKCGARVYKISGCNQMFCTACNDCAFDWVTGRIETVIHNPHYYEFQRQRNGGQAPRVAGDILCGREVDHNTTRAMAGHLPEDFLSQLITSWKGLNVGLPHIYPRPVDTRTSKEKWDAFIEDCVTNRKGLVFGSERTMNERSQNVIRELLGYSRVTMFHRLQFEEICRTIIDLRLVVLPRHHVDPLRHNEELGVDYLLGKMTDQEFATALQRADKSMQKSRDIQNVLTMVINTATDIIFRFADHVRTVNLRRKNITEIHPSDYEILLEIRELFKYANGCFERISKNYHSKSVLTIGKELDERHFWEDDGVLMYAQVDGSRAYGGHYQPRIAYADAAFVQHLNRTLR